MSCTFCDPKNTDPCGSCNKPICNNCVNSGICGLWCSNCDKAICPNCAGNCDECNEFICKKHVKEHTEKCSKRWRLSIINDS